MSKALPTELQRHLTNLNQTLNYSIGYAFSIKKTGSKSCFLPNLQQPRTSTEKQKGASIPGATFWFSVDVRGCWRFGRKHDLELGF